MPRTTQAVPAARELREAVTLVTEMSGCLGLSMDYVRDVTEKVTDRPWEELDTVGADAVVELFAAVLYRHLSNTAAPSVRRSHPVPTRGMHGRRREEGLVIRRCRFRCTSHLHVRGKGDSPWRHS